MKTLIILLALLIPYISYAGNGSGNVSNVLQLGSHNTTSVVTPIMVISDAANSLGWFSINSAGDPTSNTATPFMKNGNVFQAGANGTVCVGATGQTSGANSPWQIIYADSTFAVSASIGSLTNVKFQSGATTVYPQVNDTTRAKVVESVGGLVVHQPATIRIGYEA